MKTLPKILINSVRGEVLRLAGTFTLLCLATSVSGQSGVGDVVYTVGTVARDANNQDWAYILWQGTSPTLISNRVFAVYSKPGDFTSTAPYSRLSIITLQSDARVIEPLLRRAANLGDNMDKLGQDLQQLFASFIPAGTVSRADQLSAVMRGSLNDPRYYQNLLLLARNHPGIDLALGFADAELIAPGLTTFEVRVFDPAAGMDRGVIGRVTVLAGSPTVLPAPGPPVVVPDVSPMGDLNIKFRWGTPDNLRRLGLMQFGYNLYRVPRDFALASGWNLTNPPPITVLTNLVDVAPQVARRINHSPITPSKLFEIADAANLTPPLGDTNTSFIMDDDGRGRPNYVNYGFTNGAQFFYYVAARDILGRDGLLSTGLLATVCDRMPPYPPTAVHVLNDYQYDTSTRTSTQALRVVWHQNTQTNDTVSAYYVYRWTNLTEMNALQGDPGNNLIGIVGHIPGQTNNSYLDIGGGSPSSLNAYGETYWYTVRAADQGACGPNLSGAGGPAFGVLRQRVGPEAGTGALEINCLQPYVTAGRTTYQKLENGSDTNNYDLFLDCTRLDSRFEWAEFIGIAKYSNPASGIVTVVSNDFGQLFFLGAPAVSTWWTPPRDTKQSIVTLEVWCRAALLNGKISSFLVTQISPPDTAVYADVEFLAQTESIRTFAGGVAGAQGGCREHDPGGGGGGVFGTNNICVHVNPSPGSKEYRIYRRVDEGPLTLMAEGPITNTALPVTACENATPVNGGSMCFFVQLLDENGNPSPMTPLGCIDCAPITQLPTPVLAKITPSGNSSNPGMLLSWFCPPYGVDRFELRMAGLPTLPNTNYNALSLALASTGAPPAMMSYTNNGTNTTLPFYSFITPKAGPAFGNNGPEFVIPANVEIGKTYIVTVRSLGKNGNSSPFSDFKSFVWSPTNAPSPQVPWPARPLPPSNSSLLALAYYLAPGTNQPPALRTGTYTGNAVLVGYTPMSLRTIVSTKNGPPQVNTKLDPNALLLTNSVGDDLFPCAMYRYQLPNAAFPVTSGDTVQVSPLMEKIAYQLNAEPGTPTSTVIQDPFVTATVSSDTSNNYLWLWLLDTQPVISGARYQYVLVRFKSNHEVDQLIPSNQVEVP